VGAAHQRAGAAKDDNNHHSDDDDDRDDQPDVDDVVDGHFDDRNFDDRHFDDGRFDHIPDDHRAAWPRHWNLVADIGGARARAVAEPVALTGTALDHRYTGVP
jgi:hypothetical protein